MDEVNVMAVDVPSDLGRNWGWFLALGIGLAVLGIFGIVYASTTTAVSMYFFGGLLIAAAVIECLNAIMVGKWSGFFLHLLATLLFGVTGFLLLKYPLASAESLTALMGAYFMIGGMFEVFAPLFIGLPGAGWHVLNGIISILLGILVLMQWPFSGLWVIGMLIGIDLVFRGCTWTVFAFSLRDIRHDISGVRAELRQY